MQSDGMQSDGMQIDGVQSDGMQIDGVQSDGMLGGASRPQKVMGCKVNK